MSRKEFTWDKILCALRYFIAGKSYRVRTRSFPWFQPACTKSKAVVGEILFNMRGTLDHRIADGTLHPTPKNFKCIPTLENLCNAIPQQSNIFDQCVVAGIFSCKCYLQQRPSSTCYQPARVTSHALMRGHVFLFRFGYTTKNTPFLWSSSF